MPTLTLDTQFGRLAITETDGAITAMDWGGADAGAPTPLLQEAVAQMHAYDAGTLAVFDLPLDVAGTPFQRAVCAAMREIPYGETLTYGDIAGALNHPAQAVGRACGRNPIAVIIPCHRVLGAGGRMTGFSGGDGVETKVALLRHENAAGLLI